MIILCQKIDRFARYSASLASYLLRADTWILNLGILKDSLAEA